MAFVSAQLEWHVTTIVPTTIFRVWIDASITGGIGDHFLQNDQKDIRCYDGGFEMGSTVGADGVETKWEKNGIEG